MRIIALDTATTTGVSKITMTNVIEFESYHYTGLPTDLYDNLVPFNPDIVFYESVFIKHATAAASLYARKGYLQNRFLGVEQYDVAPATVRSALGCGRKKVDANNFLITELNLSDKLLKNKWLDDNVLDSIALGLFGVVWLIKNKVIFEHIGISSQKYQELTKYILDSAIFNITEPTKNKKPHNVIIPKLKVR